VSAPPPTATEVPSVSSNSDRFVPWKVFRPVVVGSLMLFGVLFGLWFADHDKLTALMVQQEHSTDEILKAIASIRD